MKLTNTVPAIFKFTIFAIIIGFCITACKKPSNDNTCHLNVLVVDINQTPVSGAIVKVFVDTSALSNKNKVPGGVPQTLPTGADGKVSFTFPSGILVNIYAEKTISGVVNKESSFALVNDGQTLEQRIKIRP